MFYAFIMSNVLVSVIIPVFNRERFINKSIRSILDQSLNKDQYEVIVVDDGSNDGTNQILNNYSDRIKILQQKKLWSAICLNRGIKIKRTICCKIRFRRLCE